MDGLLNKALMVADNDSCLGVREVFHEVFNIHNTCLYTIDYTKDLASVIKCQASQFCKNTLLCKYKTILNMFKIIPFAWGPK